MPTFVGNINIISRCLTFWRSDHLKNSALRGCHHSYVSALCLHPGQSQEELAASLFINKSNVAGHLAYLEEQGYVTRRVSPEDKRVTLVYPTEKLEALLPQMREVTAQWREYLSEDVDPEEMEVFHRVLERFTQKARQYAENREDKP